MPPAPAVAVMEAAMTTVHSRRHFQGRSSWRSQGARRRRSRSPLPAVHRALPIPTLTLRVPLFLHIHHLFHCFCTARVRGSVLVLGHHPSVSLMTNKAYARTLLQWRRPPGEWIGVFLTAQRCEMHAPCQIGLRSSDLTVSAVLIETDRNHRHVIQIFVVAELLVGLTEQLCYACPSGMSDLGCPSNCFSCVGLFMPHNLLIKVE